MRPFYIPFCSQDTSTHSPVIVKKLPAGGIYRSSLSLGLLTGDSGIGHLMQRVFVSYYWRTGTYGACRINYLPVARKKLFREHTFRDPNSSLPLAARMPFPKDSHHPAIGAHQLPALFLGTTASQPKAPRNFTYRFCRHKRRFAAIACGNKNSPEVSPGCFRELLRQERVVQTTQR